MIEFWTSKFEFLNHVPDISIGKPTLYQEFDRLID